jgi:hypothetical protein
MRCTEKHALDEVPARLFFKMLDEMRKIHIEHMGFYFFNMCSVVRVPELTKSSQDVVYDQFRKMMHGYRDRSGRALDLSKDKDIIFPVLQSVFQTKGRLEPRRH